MKYMKTFEGFGRQGDEEYPYPLYHEALMEYLPTVFLFDETNGSVPNYHQTFACDISDFTNLSEEDIEITYDNDGLDFIRKVETQAADRFDKILVGGLGTPWMGGRTPDSLDMHGDTLYFFGEETESNTKFLEELCENHNEFDYYPQGFYRVWWD